MPSSSITADKRPKSRGDESPEMSDDSQREQQYAPSPNPRKNRRRPTKKRQQNGPLDTLSLNNLPLNSASQTVGNTADGVTNTLGDVAGNALNKGGGDGKKSDTLRLRLDLNLEIEITLKAKIHGDLTLALL